MFASIHTNDIVFAAVLSGLFFFFLGWWLGHKSAKSSIQGIADELYKQLDLDNKDFSGKDPDDFDDDDDYGPFTGDEWKNGRKRK